MSLATTEQTETAVTKRPINTIKDLFEKARPSIMSIMPKHLTADRLIKVARVAISQNPRLMECSPRSLLQSFMTAAQLGLDIGGTLGSAYLVPFRNKKTGQYEAQFIVGYRGLIDLARRSGQIESIEARAVNEADKFELEYGLNPKLIHIPNLETSGNLKGVYAIARLKGGETSIEYMSKTEIDGIRARSRARDDGPWVTDYSEMARKTVVRRIAKYLPLTVELSEAIDKSDAAEFGGQTIFQIDEPVVEIKGSAMPAEENCTETLTNKLAAKRGPGRPPRVASVSVLGARKPSDTEEKYVIPKSEIPAPPMSPPDFLIDVVKFREYCATYVDNTKELDQIAESMFGVDNLTRLTNEQGEQILNYLKGR